MIFYKLLIGIIDIRCGWMFGIVVRIDLIFVWVFCVFNCCVDSMSVVYLVFVCVLLLGVFGCGFVMVIV